jgi:WD40 repeat protein
LSTDDWGVRALDYDPATNRIIAAGDNAVQIYDLSTHKCILRVPAPSKQGLRFLSSTNLIRDIKFLDSNSILAAQSGTLSVLDVRSGRILHQLDTAQPGISHIEIVASRYAVCAMGQPGTRSSVVVFDLKDRKLVRELGGHLEGVRHLAIVADHLVTAGAEGMIKVWRAMEDKSAQMKRHENYLRTHSPETIYKFLCIDGEEF